MAVETIGVLEQVVGGPAHLVGWSDGGIVALLVALDRPYLVHKHVVSGTCDSGYPTSWESSGASSPPREPCRLHRRRVAG